MSRVFCTLKEAAETLHASEDQIQALLDRGLLREFREGPHRLVKEADVGVLASVGEHHARRAPAESQGDVSPNAQDRVGGRAPGVARTAPGQGSPALRTAGRGPASRPGVRPTDAGRSRAAGQGRGSEDRRTKTENRGPRAETHRQRTAPSSVFRDVPRLSVRQWFWMGLVQDRPIVIALLSCLVLLGLSALAAGLCFVAETF